MPEKKNPGDTGQEEDEIFLEWAADAKPIKGSGEHVSRRSNAALHIHLRRDTDDLLRHAHRSTAVEVSSRQVDGRTGKRVKQGKIRPEARLDLHGYRYEAARTTLRRFIAAAISKDQRCVLVVTGKGDMGAGDVDMPARGIIRRALPGWLNESPLDRMVLTCETAQIEDGGTGAVYLYLRRNR